MAHYDLFIQKRFHKDKLGQIRKFSLFFSVVDLDKGKFPLNYICELPKIFRGTKYRELFPDSIRGLLLAKELLERAEKEYTDIAIRREIYSRLYKVERYLNFVQQEREIGWFYR